MVTMVAGRELDFAIAEKVMGWHAPTAHFTYWYPPGLHPQSNALGHEVPAYSTDIAAAWTVVEKLLSLKRAHVDLSIEPDGVNCYFTSYERDGDALATAAPLAICLAALKAVGELQP